MVTPKSTGLRGFFALTPYQHGIWLVMCARTLGNLAALAFLAGLAPLMGWRFFEHQIVLGLGLGVILFWISGRILRYLPNPDAPE